MKIPVSSCIAYSNKDPRSRYKILAVIGQGSYGKVLKVQHLSTGIFYAMKVLDKDKAKGISDMKELLKEVEILKSLDHPHTVKLFEYFVNKQNLFMVFELSEGGDLHSRVTNHGAMKEAEVKEVMHQLLSTICYLHSNRIIHRDLKLQNILCDQTGIKLIDFGISVLLKRGEMIKEAKGEKSHLDRIQKQ